jgi:PmbA protein
LLSIPEVFWKKQLGSVFDSYELCFVKERLKKYEAAERDLLSVEFKEEEGISMRAIKGEKMAFSYTFEKGEEAAASLLENARIIMPFLERDEFRVFPGEYTDYPEIDLYDDRGLQISEEIKVKSLLAMESAIRDFDRRITTTRNCELHESELEIRIINSNGLDTTARKTIFMIGGLAVAAEGEEVSWYDWSWSPWYNKLDLQALGTRIAGKAISFLSGEVLKTGIYPGLLTPAAACQILEILAPSFLSENLHKDKTRLKDKSNVECFSSLVNITDSGTRGIGAFCFDGEGVPSRENHLVRDGIFRGFLYDGYYAQRLKAASTGNSVRTSIKEPPRCGPRGFFVEQGKDDVANGFTDGVMIEELMGTHTANVVTGDFSVGAIGHYYSKGRSIPFKGVIFSGNLFELLTHVTAVGNDLKFYGTYGSPTLLVEGLKISGT